MQTRVYPRSIHLCFLASACLCLCAGQACAEEKSSAGIAESALAKPTSETVVGGQRQFHILQFGAVASDKDYANVQRNTGAIQKAIDACADSGGGRVVVPPGTFPVGTVVLKSNVTLHLEKGATLLGSPAVKDYPPQKPARRRRYGVYLNRSLLFAQGADRISVTGRGTLDGNSKSRNDFLGGRRIGGHRPTLILFDECTNVCVEDVTLTSAGFWTSAFTLCRNVHIDGIRITDSSFPNNDGCDICDCENVVIENCDIDCLDDAICLKGYMPCGCKNIVIRRNRLRSLCNAIKTGTDSSGGFQNLLIEDNEIHQTGISGIALEIVDGGTMRNVIVRNIRMDGVGTPIFIKLGNRNRPLYDGQTNFKVSNGVLRDVHISGIRATVRKPVKVNDAERRRHNYHCYASSITGFPGHWVERVQIEDVKITIEEASSMHTAKDAKRKVPERSNTYPENRMFGVLPAYGFYIRHAKDITMKNVWIGSRSGDGRPALVLDDVHESTFKDIETVPAVKTPTFVVEPNCTNVELDEE